MVRLVDLLERWVASSGEDVTVVFERPPSPPISSTVIEVAHAPRPGPDSADDEIVRRLADDSVPAEVRVVVTFGPLARRSSARRRRHHRAGRRIPDPARGPLIEPSGRTTKRDRRARPCGRGGALGQRALHPRGVQSGRGARIGPRSRPGSHPAAAGKLSLRPALPPRVPRHEGGRPRARRFAAASRQPDRSRAVRLPGCADRPGADGEGPRGQGADGPGADGPGAHEAAPAERRPRRPPPPRPARPR